MVVGTQIKSVKNGRVYEVVEILGPGEETAWITESSKDGDKRLWPVPTRQLQDPAFYVSFFGRDHAGC